MNKQTDIRIGDVLSRPKALGIVTHLGVVVAPGLVIQNRPGKGEHLATLKEFAGGKPVTVHRTAANPAEVTARAQAVLANPQGYDPIKNNCEHTVTRIIQGIARSPQLALIVTVVIVGGLVLVLKKR